MAEEENKKRRIGNMQGVFMIGVALTIDGVQVLLDMVFIGLILDSFISIFAWMLFWFWFRLNDVSFLRGKAALLRLVAISGAGIIEIIPLVNDIPSWTFAVAIMLATIAIEDSVKNISFINKFGINKVAGLNKNKNVRIRRNKRVSIA